MRSNTCRHANILASCHLILSSCLVCSTFTVVYNLLLLNILLAVYCGNGNFRLKPVAGFEKGQSNEPVQKVHFKDTNISMLITFEIYHENQETSYHKYVAYFNVL